MTVRVLDSGKYNLNSMMDAAPLPRQFTIDYHAEPRAELPEMFTYSSNVGTAKMALGMGVEHLVVPQRWAQLDRLRTELRKAPSRSCQRWAEISTVTIAFRTRPLGAPLQAVAAVSALMNGGYSFRRPS
jgi:cell division protein FtsI (penicillin-binding protein 3)